MRRITFGTAMLLASLALRLFGQATSTGAINGTVTDPSGQTVSDAQVVLLNEGMNIQESTTTNGQGQYRFLNLLPAAYSLSVEASGFKTVRIAPFRINVNQTLTEDLALQLGEVSQKVEVAAQSELVERTTVEVGTVIQEKAMRDLPLNGRNYTQLISLTPGANGTHINGQWADGNEYMLDGASNTSILGASSAYIPILDTIQEFTIQAHSDKAEFGGFLGATVSAVTRSGQIGLPDRSGNSFATTNLPPVTPSPMLNSPRPRRSGRTSLEVRSGALSLFPKSTTARTKPSSSSPMSGLLSADRIPCSRVFQRRMN